MTENETSIIPPIKQPLNRHLIASVHQVKDYIDRYPLEWKNLDDLAAMVAINRKKLQQAFKCRFGVNISDYKLQKRMNAAADLLEEGRLSKKQIAYRCGYHKPNNFSIAFKKVYKMSPSDFQHRCEQLPPLPSQ
jgi:two-component system response regulator YesN